MFSDYSKTENKSYAQVSWSHSVAYCCERCSYHLSEGMPLHSSTQGMKRQRSRWKCLHSLVYWCKSDTSRSWRRMHGIVLKHPYRSKLRRYWWKVAKSELRLRFGQPWGTPELHLTVAAWVDLSLTLQYRLERLQLSLSIPPASLSAYC